MDDSFHPQCRIVPIRMLHPDHAGPFIEGLSRIQGVRRMLVHGPAFASDHPGKTVHSCEIQPPEFTGVAIGDQIVDMHVLMADLTVEAINEETIDRIGIYCEEFFTDLPYQILVGKFLKTKPSLSDYIRDGQDPERLLLGLTDSHERIETAYLSGDPIGS
ncbi:methyl-coenzyme M reductase operon protein D [uncultured Methanospirillum sp.]|uniref:methyl-coenzyme M reductase operon protein D n=1 Tax=uncultured Methanospirillum sp. TaxID=262503 RepID=UPI0029C70186|nr:methyl-coenzyme M reductase operon protein D [uncultured Methanospirillum sp.]